MQPLTKAGVAYAVLISTSTHPMESTSIPPALEKALCCVAALACGPQTPTPTPHTPTMKELWEQRQPKSISSMDCEDPKCDLNHTLCVAARDGNTEDVVHCLGQEADIHAHEDRALRCAISEEDHADTVQALLDHGANIHALHNDPLVRILREYPFQLSLMKPYIEAFQSGDDAKRLTLLKKMCKDFETKEQKEQPKFYNGTSRTFKTLWSHVILELKKNDNTGKLTIVKILFDDLRAFDKSQEEPHKPQSSHMSPSPESSHSVPSLVISAKILPSDDMPPSYAEATQAK